MRLRDVFRAARWEIVQTPFAQDGPIDVVEREVGTWEPFHVDRLQPGLAVVWCRRRLGFAGRLAAWWRSRRFDDEHAGTPDDIDASEGGGDVLGMR